MRSSCYPCGLLEASPYALALLMVVTLVAVLAQAGVLRLRRDEAVVLLALVVLAALMWSKTTVGPFEGRLLIRLSDSSGVTLGDLLAIPGLLLGVRLVRRSTGSARP